MRDKLIDIILAAQGYKGSSTLAQPLKAMYESAWAVRKQEAEKIADALLDECYIFHSDFCIEVDIDDPLEGTDETK